MRDWSKPKEQQVEQRDWSKPKPSFGPDNNPHALNKRRNPLPGEGFGLGLAQWLENTLKMQASHGAEPEVDIPDFLRHPKLLNKPETNRSPSFNFEQYVNPEQQLQFKVGEYGPDVLAGGLGLARLGKKLTSASVGKGIVKDVKDLKSAFNKEYNSIFDIAEKSGLENIESKVNNADLRKVLSEVDNKYYKGISNFIENPTARNAHFAQSDLGKFIRKMESKRELVSSEQNALKAARKTQEMLKREVYSSLLKQGGLDLPFKYQDVTNRYSKQMVPYLENTAVRKALLKPGQKGYIKPSRLPGKLKSESSDPLMEHLRGNIEGTKIPVNPALKGKHPLLGINQFLSSPIMKYGIGLPGLGYGGYELWKQLMKGG